MTQRVRQSLLAWEAREPTKSGCGNELAEGNLWVVPVLHDLDAGGTLKKAAGPHDRLTRTCQGSNGGVPRTGFRLRATPWPALFIERQNRGTGTEVGNAREDGGRRIGQQRTWQVHEAMRYLKMLQLQTFAGASGQIPGQRRGTGGWREGRSPALRGRDDRSRMDMERMVRSGWLFGVSRKDTTDGLIRRIAQAFHMHITLSHC